MRVLISVVHMQLSNPLNTAASRRLVEPDLDLSAVQQGRDLCDFGIGIGELGSVAGDELFDDVAQRLGGELIGGDADAWCRVHSYCLVRSSLARRSSLRSCSRKGKC